MSVLRKVPNVPQPPKKWPSRIARPKKPRKAKGPRLFGPVHRPRLARKANYAPRKKGPRAFGPVYKPRLAGKANYTPRRRGAKGSRLGRKAVRAVGGRSFGSRPRAASFGFLMRWLRLLAVLARRKKKIQGARNHGFTGVKTTGATGFAGMRPPRGRLF